MTAATPQPALKLNFKEDTLTTVSRDVLRALRDEIQKNRVWGITGATSNPTIVSKIIGRGHLDRRIGELIEQDNGAGADPEPAATTVPIPLMRLPALRGGAPDGAVPKHSYHAKPPCAPLPS